MGYADTVGSSFLELYSDVKGVVILDAISSNEIGPSITTPNWKGSLSHAYIDTIVNEYSNSDVADNYLISGATAILIGGTYRHCSDLSAGAFLVAPTTRTLCNYVFNGYLDIASYLAKGTTYDTYFHNAVCNRDHLSFYSVYARLRLYFN